MVLTEWMDAKGHRVIIPLHLDQNGAITLQNNIASAFGADSENYLSTLLGENNQNVLYTKDNKSIDQLLSERLQLPEAMADDTLVNHSIAQGSEESKPIYPVFDKDGNVTNGYGQSTQEKQLFDYFREKNPDASDDTIRDMVQWRIAEQKIEDGVPLEEAQPAALREFTAAVEQTANTTIRYGERTDSGEAVGELGAYDRGANTIWINPRIATKASVLKSVMHHELIHRIEGSSFYDAIADMALKSRFGTAEGAAIENAVTDMQQSRAEKGETLSRQRAKQEVVAEIMQELIDSEERLQRAVTEAPRAGEGLLRAVRNMIELVKTFAQADSGNRLGAVQELRRLQAIEKNLTKALAEARKNAIAKDGSGVQHHISRNAAELVHKIAEGKRFLSQIRLRDFTPKALVERGVPDLPMLMNASHIAENILTEEEAKKLGLPIRDNSHFHGLGESAFLQAIDAMDGPIEVYRWKKNTHNNYGPNDYIVITQARDSSENQIIVPIVIQSTGRENYVYIETNEIKSVYGKNDLRDYLNRYTQDYSLTKIKNRSHSAKAGVQSPGVRETASANTRVSQDASGVNNHSMPNSEKNTQRAGEAGGDYEFDADDFAGWQNRYDEALEQYGAIPEGENAVRDVPVPKRMDGQTHVRRGARTVIESEYTPDEMVNRVKQAIAEDAFSYSRISNDGAIRYADRMIAEHGFEGAMEKWRAVVGGEGIAKVKDLVLGETLYQLAAKNGETELAMQIAAELTAEATAAGQTVQAMRIMKQATPAGRLYALEKVVNKLNGEYASKIDSGKMKTITIPAELAEQLLRAQTKGEIVTALAFRILHKTRYGQLRRYFNQYMHMAGAISASTIFTPFHSSFLRLLVFHCKILFGDISEQMRYGIYNST